MTRLHVAPPAATHDTNVEQATLDLDVAPTAAQSADPLRDEALRLAAAGLSVRAVGEQLGISKDKVWRWVRQARSNTGDTAVVAG
ncbi:helix-turn-helix domain-containing protein (plasmid) [Rhodococcus aetherivorans]